MRSDQRASRHRSAGQSGAEMADTRDPTPRSEDLLVRSYDHQWAYDVEIEVVADDGDTAFRERYHLLPGHTESETGVLPDGEYEVRVTLDNGDRHRLDCRIDSAPEHTAVVEVGNGALSLVEGLYS